MTVIPDTPQENDIKTDPSAILALTQQILAKLIAFPTVSSDSNLDLIHYAETYFKNLGARVRLVHDETGSKANLFATLGPDIGGGIMLSGHTDVVPVEGQNWSTDPFQMHSENDALYGRGSCDMKGFIAAAMAVAPFYAKLDLVRPIHFCLSYDEETGCLGAANLVEQMKSWKHLPAVAIIGEPTEMRVIEGHKGCCKYTTTFTGLAGHGSEPRAGVNAVEYAVRYISELMTLQQTLKDTAPAGNRFEPPWTTLQVGQIDGGTAHNIIPWECTVDWEMRPIQAGDVSFVKDHIQNYSDTELLPAMKAVSKRADISTEALAEVIGLEPTTENQAKEILCELTGQDQADFVAFGTEAGLFQSLGIHSVVCGPGSIAQAHKPNEYVSILQMQSCIDMLLKLSRKLI